MRGQTVEWMATHQEGGSQEQVWDSLLLVLSVCHSREEEEALTVLLQQPLSRSALLPSSGRQEVATLSLSLSLSLT